MIHATPSGPAERGPARASSAGPRAAGARRGVRGRLHALLTPPPDPDRLVDDAPPLTVPQAVRRFVGDLVGVRRWMLLAALLALAIAGVTVVEITLFSRVVDEVLVPADLSALWWLVPVYLGLALLSGVLSGAEDYTSTWVYQTVAVRLRSRVFRHVVSLPATALDQRRLGDSLTRLTSDTSATVGLLTSTLPAAVTSSLTAVLYLGALVWLDPWLTLAAVAVAPVFAYVSHRFARLVVVSAREQRRRGGSSTAIAEEHLASVPLVQAYTREDAATERYTRENLGTRAAHLSASRVRAVFLPLTDLAELIGILFVIAVGVTAMSSGRLSLGELLAFLTLLLQLYSPLRALAGLLPTALTESAGAERVSDLLDEDPPHERPDAVELGPGRHDLRLVGVDVTYPGAVSPALAGIDLEVRAGEVVAVVGPSGAGKSTLVKLLTRAVEPDGGSVSVGGHPVADLTLRSLREVVGYVPQETVLLDASVRDNLRFARPDATDAQIEAAARAAEIHEVVMALPDAYETRLGQRARTLSGGQRQRLALARALLRDSSVLVLDEPTTGLDAATARRVLAPVRAAAADGHAVLVVTHDPVAIAAADRVVTLDAGHVTDVIDCRRPDTHESTTTEVTT